MLYPTWWNNRIWRELVFPMDANTRCILLICQTFVWVHQKNPAENLWWYLGSTDLPVAFLKFQKAIPRNEAKKFSGSWTTNFSLGGLSDSFESCRWNNGLEPGTVKWLLPCETSVRPSWMWPRELRRPGWKNYLEGWIKNIWSNYSDLPRPHP